MASVRQQTVRVPVVKIPAAARRSEPPAVRSASETQRMAKVSQEDAEAYRILLESERRLKVEQEFEALADGWGEDE